MLAGAGAGAVVDEELLVLLCVVESIFVLLEALGVEFVLGALEPPAALESLSSLDFELDVEPLLDWSLSFFCLRSPLCLPLFWCSRPCASVVTFGLSVGPAFGVSDVLAPAPAFAPIEALPLAFRLDGGDDSAEGFGGRHTGSVELLFL